MPVNKIDANEARNRLQRGALLVCAYDLAEKCQRYKLEDAITFEELEERKASMAKDQELIFYCA